MSNTMFDFLSVLAVLPTERHADLRQRIATLAATLESRSSDYELILLAITPAHSDDGALIAGIRNVKLIRVVTPDPDAIFLEGLQRASGDAVILAPIERLDARIVDAMIGEAHEGHEVVDAVPRDMEPAAIRFPVRLMTRAAMHYVLRAGAGRKGLLHQVTMNPLFNPARIECGGMPIEKLRGLALRRRYRALFASQTAPLRILSTLALGGAVLNLLYSFYVLGIYWLKSDVAPGWATLSLQTSGMFFLFSGALFVLSEYLIHIIRVFQAPTGIKLVHEIRSATVGYDRGNLERVGHDDA